MQKSYEFLIICNWFHLEYLAQIWTNKNIEFGNFLFAKRTIFQEQQIDRGIHRH